MGELRDKHDREWVRPQLRLEFVWDYFDNDFVNHSLRYELLNIEGENAERGTTQIDNSTQEERDAVKTMMMREFTIKALDDNFIPYPRMRVIFPQQNEIITGQVVVQIQVQSLVAGEMTVEFRVDGGSWMSATYNAGSEYYENSVNSAGLPNGSHQFEARAQNGGGVLLEMEPFRIEVNN